MKATAWIASIAALGLTIVPPVLFFAKSLPEDTMKLLMLIAVFLWFIAWPLANRGDA